MAMERIKKFFTKDPGYKLLSIAIAIVLWFIVINIENPIETRKYTVDISIQNPSYLEDNGIVVMNMEELDSKSVTVSVKGERAYLDRLNTSGNKIEATANFRNASVDAKEGYASVPVDIVMPYSGGNLEIISRSIRSLSLSIQEYISVEMKVDVEILGAPAEGYIVDTPYVYPKTVTVSGARQDVEAVKAVKARVSVDALTEDLSVATELAAYAEDGARTMNIALSHQNADISVFIKQQKNVRVRYVTSGVIGESYEISGVSLSPDNIDIIGYKSDLDEVEYIDLPVVSLKDLTESKEFGYEVSSLLPTGLKPALSNQRVVLNIEVRAIERITMTIPVEDIILDGAPENNMSISFVDESVELVLKGDPEAFENFNKEDVSLTLEVEGLARGTYEKAARIKLPEGIELSDENLTVVFAVGEAPNSEEAAG